MARVEVKLTISPHELDLITQCLDETEETYQEMIDDPVVKLDDKKIPAQIVSEIQTLRIHLRG